MEEPHFTNLAQARVAVVGLGLMGGSLALALRGHCRALSGADSDPAALAYACQHGIIDEATDFQGAQRADVLVLAAPVRAILAQLAQLADGPAPASGVLVLDLGSTKGDIAASMRALPPGFAPVGGHPMCGKEVSGVSHAEAGLFRDRVFVLTPLDRTPDWALSLARQIALAVGARPVELTPERHDQLAAAASHLPYLAAAGLVRAAEGLSDEQVWQIAASGFRDTSRLAASDVTMMTDILLTNRQAIAAALDRYQAELGALMALLESGDADALAAYLASVAERRRSLFSPMTHLEIEPIAHPLQASVRVPGSKSLTNRALLIAALADGRTTLTNALFSDDSRYFAQALSALGFAVEADETAATVTVAGQGGRIPAAAAELFIGNAGTAARFLTALLTLGRGSFVLDGGPRMRERPLADLLDALRQLGAQVDSPSGCPPVRVTAAGLRGGQARVAGDVSSQYLSGLLLVAPYAEAPVELCVERGLNSQPYVDLTISIMDDFGVVVEREGYERFCVQPARYQPRHTYAIESDASAASYFLAAPAILGGTVRVENLSRRSRQGDVAFVDVLAQMGCVLSESGNALAVTGPGPGNLRGVEVDMRHIPDTAQTLAAIAPFANSPTVIRGIASARVKETDRVAAMRAELRRLGVRVEEYPDGLKIYPAEQITPATVQTYDDHRMAMAFALTGLRSAGVAIENPDCVAKTFPNFFAVLAQLRTG